VLAAARGGAKGKVIAVVEPHRFTRVRDLFEDFARCFKDADHVIVAPLYTAGEAPIAGVDHQALASRITTSGRRPAEAVDEPADIAPAIKRIAVPGDIVVCLGAGNSTDWAHALPDWLGGTAQRAGSAA
jgi:UDP-N-acetylmuramate--alanine ligase